MRTTIRYFAYGSNLDAHQMRVRCPGSRFLTRATLQNHALAFGGFSPRWGGGVATIVRDRGSAVPGVIYELQPSDLVSLDGYEGHPISYRREVRVFLTEEGTRTRAMVYIKPQLDPFPPPRRYLDVMRTAYSRHGFNRKTLAIAAREVWQ